MVSGSNKPDDGYQTWFSIPLEWVLIALFLLLLYLKVKGLIDWSWYVATLPLWVVPAVYLLVGAVIVFMTVLRHVENYSSNQINTNHE